MANASWRRRESWNESKMRTHECERKIKYVTRAHARRARAEIVNRTDDDKGMNVYECRWCGGYHIGHPRTVK